MSGSGGGLPSHFMDEVARGISEIIARPVTPHLPLREGVDVFPVGGEV